MSIQLKRVYDVPSREDGFRILIDRLWPRGVSKEKAHVEDWIKDIGPSHDLRKWFQHDPDKFVSFKRKYLHELKSGDQREALKKLKQIVRTHDVVTLVFATRETKHNHAVVLKELIDSNPM